MIVKLKSIISILFIAIILVACADKHPPPVAGAYPRAMSPGKQGAVAGAVGGGILGGAITHTAIGVPFGMAAGAIVLGGIIGSQSVTPSEFLQHNGINVVHVGDLVEIIIPADKIFLPNSTEIKYKGEPLMYAVVDVINSFGKVNLDIAGHTDSVGDAPHKMHLSQLWSQSVATYLWAHGIALERMHFKGLSGFHDIASTRTAKGSYYNRRVEIVFWVHHSNFV